MNSLWPVRKSLDLSKTIESLLEDNKPEKKFPEEEMVNAYNKEVDKLIEKYNPIIYSVKNRYGFAQGVVTLATLAGVVYRLFTFTELFGKHKEYASAKELLASLKSYRQCISSENAVKRWERVHAEVKEGILELEQDPEVQKALAEKYDPLWIAGIYVLGAIGLGLILRRCKRMHINKWIKKRTEEKKLIDARYPKDVLALSNYP